MPQIAEVLLAVGGILLAGLATDYLGKRTPLPRVTLLLVLGILVGDDFLGLIPAAAGAQFDLVSTIALMMVGFLLGGKLTRPTLMSHGGEVLSISATAAALTSVIVTLLLTAFGASLDVAILLGCIAAATAPAATFDTVMQTGVESRFSRRLLAIVAIDDVWAIIIFSFGLSLVAVLSGVQGGGASILHAAYEIGAAVMLGGCIGLPASYLTGRLKPGQPMLMEALGIVFLCGSLAIMLEASFLIAVMVMGVVIANLAKHHDYPFHEIENVEWPFMALFFVLAGASLELGALSGLGLIGAIYVVSRVIGKILGSWIGARVGGADANTRRWLGLSLMPQAGLPVGMVLVASSRYPELGPVLLPVVIGTTVVFDVVGPICTRVALAHTADPEDSAAVT